MIPQYRFIRNSISVVTLTAFLSACSSNVHYQGKKVEEEDLSQLKTGLHNKQDVARILGSPSTTTGFSDDKWYYVSKTTEAVSFLKPDVKDQQVLALKFDQSGLLREIEEHDITAGKEVDYVERVTSTAGQQKSFFQQVFGNFGRMARQDNGKMPKQ